MCRDGTDRLGLSPMFLETYETPWFERVDQRGNKKLVSLSNEIPISSHD